MGRPPTGLAPSELGLVFPLKLFVVFLVQEDIWGKEEKVKKKNEIK